MGNFNSITSEEAHRAMLDGLTSMIRDRLRERIMQAIEPEIDAAVDAGLEQFKATIASFRDHASMRDTVKVLIERRPLKTAEGTEK